MDKLDKQEAEASSFRMDKLKEVERASKKSHSIATNRPSSPLIPDDDDIPSSKTASISKTKVSDSNTSEKSVAGRKKMKGGEKYDMATGKEAAMVVDKEGTSGKDISSEKKEETPEEHEIEVELNLILKKGPSKSHLSFSQQQMMLFSTADSNAAKIVCYELIPLHSHYIFQNILPILQKSQGHSLGKIQYSASPLRCRTRQSSPWSRPPIRPI